MLVLKNSQLSCVAMPYRSSFLALISIFCFNVSMIVNDNTVDAWQILHPDRNHHQQQHHQKNRRDVIQQSILTSGIGAALSVLIDDPQSASAAQVDLDGTEISSYLAAPATMAKNGFSVYQVIPDSSEKLSPKIQPVKPQNLCNILSLCKEKIINKDGGAIWLGEHHNSKRDHDLQADLIRSIYKIREANNSNPLMSIGLEQVQVQFQPVLDAYIEGRITEENMLQNVQWEKRWSWSYDNYRPVFELARELKIPLIALNVNTEDLAVVEESGFQGLSKEQVHRYIKDPNGFGEFAKPLAYRTYISYVIEPSYDLHVQMGLLRTKRSGETMNEDMTFRNFFSGRILWDEAMAGNAYSWNMNNPGGLMVGLVGADHVKFEKGITGRYERLVNRTRESVSILLNPTLIDTRPSGSVSSYMNAASSSYPDQITLQLRYLKDGVDSSSKEMRSLPVNTGGVLSLADYIILSNESA